MNLGMPETHKADIFTDENAFGQTLLRVLNHELHFSSIKVDCIKNSWN